MESALALAQRFGTPLVVYDLDKLDAAVARVLAAAKLHDVEVSYAGKAFLCVAFARYLHERGIGIDVSSLGEFETVRRADIPPEELTLHGCMKSDAEISLAVDGFVGRSVVDGCEELARTIERSSTHRPTPILLRLNTGIAASTHAAIRTAGEASKFGMPPDAEAEAIALLRAANGRVHFLGLHAHLGSQIDERAAFVAHGIALIEAAARFAAAGFPVEHLVLGGGFVEDPAPALEACIPG
ncbi:MAG: diaminopimelate decarboxylase, partial [Candidatus Eremiobacteraeota bacterium]|nr:diaminopimelate decarboxylase [Candidatus Eremiobacteraeota bacterium]